MVVGAHRVGRVPEKGRAGGGASVLRDLILNWPPSEGSELRATSPPLKKTEKHGRLSPPPELVTLGAS